MIKYIIKMIKHKRKNMTFESHILLMFLLHDFPHYLNNLV